MKLRDIILLAVIGYAIIFGNIIKTNENKAIGTVTVDVHLNYKAIPNKSTEDISIVPLLKPTINDYSTHSKFMSGYNNIKNKNNNNLITLYRVVRLLTLGVN